MIYPKFLSKNDTVAVIAPSNGVSDNVKLNRLNNSIKYFENLSFNVIQGENIRTSIDGRSGSVYDRLQELYKVYNNNKVKFVCSVSGGEYLKEILNNLDYNVIKNNVKWLQGYSDPTGLLYTITTKLDIATIYGCNFCSFGMNKLHKSLENNINILKGNIIVQNSFSKYENGYYNYVTGLEEYNLDKDVKWVNLNDKKEIKLKGRIIGGCLDVLLDIAFSKFDYTNEFLNRYKDDKIIWYFDNYNINEDNILQSLNVLKSKNWFKNIGGIVFGRNTMDLNGVTDKFKLEVEKFIKDLNIDVIFDMDIGHKPPTLTIINGSLVEITSNENICEFKTYLN